MPEKLFIHIFGGKRMSGLTVSAYRTPISYFNYDMLLVFKNFLELQTLFLITAWTTEIHIFGKLLVETWKRIKKK